MELSGNLSNIERTTLISYLFGKGIGDTPSCILEIKTVKLSSSKETKYA